MVTFFYDAENMKIKIVRLYAYELIKYYNS